MIRTEGKRRESSRSSARRTTGSADRIAKLHPDYTCWQGQGVAIAGVGNAENPEKTGVFECRDALRKHCSTAELSRHLRRRDFLLHGAPLGGCGAATIPC